MRGLDSAKWSLAGAILLLAPAIALAESALLTDTVELRGGPGADHARVAEAEEGARVKVFRCENRWCRIAFGRERGWVPGSCLAAANKADAGSDGPRGLPLVLGPGPVRSSTFNPPDWPGQSCPQP